MSRILTLTTDFGTRDAYVAAMKGVILSIAPDVRLVDISHEIAPQDVMEAAFVLRNALPYYPPDTVHLAVVDPGVGTARRAVALQHGAHQFVGPDNGLFALLLGDEAPDAAVVLDRREAWRAPDVSATFHGRDVFAPVAGRLAAGQALTDVGSPIDRLESLHWALPIADEQGAQGWVVHVDHFGNCITNVGRDVLEAHRNGRPLKCFVGDTIVEDIRRAYGTADPGEPLLLYNSADYLEIAVRGGNASQLLGIRKGASVNIVFRDRR